MSPNWIIATMKLGFIVTPPFSGDEIRPPEKESMTQGVRWEFNPHLAPRQRAALFIELRTPCVLYHISPSAQLQHQ